MRQPFVTRRFLRVRGGLAFALILVAAGLAAGVIAVGQSQVERREASARALDAALIVSGQASLALEKVSRREGEVARSALRTQLRGYAAELGAARASLEALTAANQLAPETARIAALPVFNPWGLMAEVETVALAIAAGDQGAEREQRLGDVGLKVTARLLPALTRMKETERLAASAASRAMMRYGLGALVVLVLVLIAAIVLVYAPMERAILSAQRRIEEERRAAEAASAAKTRFLATVSHEIRTPMNGVIGMTELLRAGDLDPRRREMVEVVHASGEAMLEIINDLLDISKIEAGKMELERAPVDVDRICADVARLFAGRAQWAGLRLSLDIEPAEGPWRRIGDAKALRQILSNLVGNALKFTNDGEVTIGLREAPGGIALWVRDEGVGIPHEAQGRIFDSYEQADDATTRVYGGTGLGLSIVRGLVEAMGGAVTVDSAPEKGALFCVMAPLPAAPAQPSGSDEPGRSEARRAGPGDNERTPARPHETVLDDGLQG